MAETLISTMEQRSHTERGYMGYTYHHPYYMYAIYKHHSATQWTIDYVEGKESVQDGVFIPGQYRVNPYSAKEFALQHDHNGLGAAFRSEGLELDVQGYPGIDPSAGVVIGDRDPVYFVTRTLYSPHNRNVRGYLPGVPYYDVWYIVGDWWRYRHAALADMAVTPRNDSTYKQLALQKATAKLGSADLELGETIGEYRQTIEMLKNPLSGLKKFLLDDKSRNFRLLTALVNKDKRTVAKLTGRTGVASADAMASTWLELRYGLRPLVMLIQDVIDRIDGQRRSLVDPDKIRSARSKLTFSHEDWEWVTTNYGSYPFIRSRAKVEEDYQVTASVQYRQTADQSFLDSLGLTPRFLPEVAWQLTTCSFVVDWIFSISDFLGTLRINPNIEVLGNTVGVKRTRKVSLVTSEIIVPNWNNDGWKPLTVHGGQTPGEDLMFEYNHYDREVNVSLSYLPHFTYGRVLDLFKAIDSVSLIWQFAKKLK